MKLKPSLSDSGAGPNAELLRQLIDSLSDFLYVKDPRSRFVFNNLAHRRSLGAATLDEVTGKTDYDFFPKEIANLYHADEQALIQTGKTVDREETLVDAKTGETRWLLTTKVPLKDEAGAVFGLVGIVRDITAIKRAQAELAHEITERNRVEAALRVSQGFLHSLVENLPINIIRKDREGRITFANRMYCERIGLPLEQVLGKTVFDFLPASLAAYQHGVDLKIMASGEVHEVTEEQSSAAGRPAFLHMIKVPVYDGGQCVGVQGMFLDVTERKLAEEELRAKTALLEAQVHSSIDGILVVDNDGKKIIQNQRTLELWKIPPEIGGENDDEKQIQFIVNRTKHPDKFVEKVRHLYSHPNESSRDEIELKDGMVLDRYSAPVIDKEGKHYGRIWAFRDITERKRSEAELEKVHRELLDISRQTGMAEVATSVLHNVGNVLNSVNVSATLVANHVRQTKAVNIAKIAELLELHKADLAGFFTKDPRGQTIPAYLSSLAEMLVTEQKTLISELEQLRKNVDHIKDIVAMQQDYARASGITETLPVTDIIEESLRINASSLAKHEVDTVCDFQTRPLVTTEKHKVMLILINLVRNAKEACDDSGHADKRITVRTTSDDHGVKIAIIDNGIGIPAENLTRIFNHGFTTRKQGHGFGLHSSALAAKKLGGSITVESGGPGLGAMFVLELPYRSDISGA